MPQFIYQFVSWSTFGLFYLLVIMNNIAVNISVEVFLLDVFFTSLVV